MRSHAVLTRDEVNTRKIYHYLQMRIAFRRFYPPDGPSPLRANTKRFAAVLEATPEQREVMARGIDNRLLLQLSVAAGTLLLLARLMS